MPVLINFKICDNSMDCSGIRACPTGAFRWDEEKEKITVDGSECVECGRCEEACPVGAIHVARTEGDYESIKKEIEEDPRRVSDLFIDRYGAEPVHPAFSIPQSKFGVQILNSTKPAVVELFKGETIRCLIKCIPVKKLLGSLDVKYRKVEVENDEILERYGIGELPALLFFKDGEMVGNLEGHYELDGKEELRNKIEDIMSKEI